MESDGSVLVDRQRIPVRTTTDRKVTGLEQLNLVRSSTKRDATWDPNVRTRDHSLSGLKLRTEVVNERHTGARSRGAEAMDDPFVVADAVSQHTSHVLFTGTGRKIYPVRHKVPVLRVVYHIPRLTNGRETMVFELRDTQTQEPRIH